MKDATPGREPGAMTGRSHMQITYPDGFKPGYHLNWKGGQHWGSRRAKCIHCAGQTWLRDESGRYAHKVCAELQLFLQQSGRTRSRP